MCRDFFVKTVERGGYRGAILVVIIGFRQWGGQGRSKYGPELAPLIFIYAKLLASEPLKGPSRTLGPWDLFYLYNVFKI